MFSLTAEFAEKTQSTERKMTCALCSAMMIVRLIIIYVCALESSMLILIDAFMSTTHKTD